MILTHDGIVHEGTEAKAVLFKFEDSNVWIPKSIISDYTDNIVEVKRWFAEERGLEVYESQ